MNNEEINEYNLNIFKAEEFAPLKKFYSVRAFKAKQEKYKQWKAKQEEVTKILAECEELYSKYDSDPIATQHLLNIYNEKCEELEVITGEMIAAGMPNRMDEDERPIYYHQRSGTIWMSGRVSRKIM